MIFKPIRKRSIDNAWVLVFNANQLDWPNTEIFKGSLFPKAKPLH